MYMHKNSINITVKHDGQFWIGVFERQDENGYAAAQHIFGAEPSEPVLYNFLLKETSTLKFSTPLVEKFVAKTENYKRRLRNARKIMHNKSIITKAHAAIKAEQGQQKISYKQKTKEAREQQRDLKFALKQEKRKKKHNGH
jgi:hypothetical protein